ncbi:MULTISPECIES: tetratricopeptide repeat protein [unclassified Microcoleus]|uniref:tetratricopeptide repeat protein n=1 Tax=unclassified Microcoleus TaxID=2642155 RepID=UPI002FD1467F
MGRESIVEELLPKLQGQTRLLWIKGISGIGKTTLGECLASKAWEKERSFEWIYLEILEGQSPDFASVAAELLAKLGDRELDPQERNNPDRLAKRLLQKLQSHSYWIQMDSLERLLNPEQPTEFVDAYWANFLQRFLTHSNVVSRLVLTAQAIPTELAEFSDRYPNTWAEYRLNGLLQLEQLEFFAKRNVVVEPSNQDILTRIAKIYEGHPLVLKVIAEDILQEFAGDVSGYWQVYQPEFEQVARELQTTRLDETEYNEALDRKVRERIKKSLEKLSADALDLLCRSAVFRRPVPKKFWLAMIGDRSVSRQKEAYRVLCDRALVEREKAQNHNLIRQHNLICYVAYDSLRQYVETWKTAERQAAHCWLTDYEPPFDAPNLETLRGDLEAFHHYCEIEDWTAAKTILLDKEVGVQLQTWGNYREVIFEYQRISNQLSIEDEIICMRRLGNSCYFLGKYVQAINFQERSLRLSQIVKNRLAEGTAFTNIGLVYNSMGQYKRAIEYQEKSLEIAREIDDRHGERVSLGNLGLAYNNLGLYEQAINSYQQGLTIAKELCSRYGEGNTLCGLGNAYFHLGQYERTINFNEQYLKITREIGDRIGEGNALGNLGLAYRNLGLHQRAIDFHEQHLKITQEIGDRPGEGNVLGDLGRVFYALKQYDRALDFHQQYLKIAQEIGNRQGEGIALVNLGVTQLKLEQCSDSLTNIQLALELFQEIGDRANEATALKNFAELHQALGEVEVAQQYCQQALALATELGIPLAAECEALQLKIENEKLKMEETQA